MVAVWWESATVMDTYLHLYLLSHLMISGLDNRYFLTPFFWWGYWDPKMLGKWLGLLKLEVAAQEATPALLGDVAMSSPWVTFSHSAIQSRGRRRSSPCCTPRGHCTSLCGSDAPQTAGSVLSRCLCWRCLSKEGTQVSLLVLRGDLPGAVDIRVYSAASLAGLGPVNDEVLWFWLQDLPGWMMFPFNG